MNDKFAAIEAAAKEQAYQESMRGSIAGAAMGLSQRYEREQSQQCMQASFSDRLLSQLHRAESGLRDHDKLSQLVKLFDKHPDVLKIIELMMDLRLIG